MDEESENWFLAWPCGNHGPYSFYRTLRYINHADPSLDQSLSLGQHFYARIGPQAPVSIGELQLLWENHRDEGLKLASVKLYYLPEDTPAGRLPAHGEDELLVVDKKIVLEVKDLVRWFVDEPVNWRESSESEGVKQGGTVSSHPSAIDNRGTTGRLTLVPDSICFLSFPRYCRYRAVKKRLEGSRLYSAIQSRVRGTGEATGEGPSATLVKNLEPDQNKTESKHENKSTVMLEIKDEDKVEVKEIKGENAVVNGIKCEITSDYEAAKLNLISIKQENEISNTESIKLCDKDGTLCNYAVDSKPNISTTKQEITEVNGIVEGERAGSTCGGCGDKMIDRMVCAIGGRALYVRGARVVFCRDAFSHPELDRHEFRRDGLAPKLKGRKRRIRLRLNQPITESDRKRLFPVKMSSSPKNSMPQSNSKLEKVLSDAAFFHTTYNKFMNDKKTPVKRPPYLGFKEVDMHEFFKLVNEFGGYKKATQCRVWKVIYDQLGGHTSNTGAATCTRRIYEKLLLGYERHLREDHRKFYSKVKAPVQPEGKVVIQISKTTQNSIDECLSVIGTGWEAISESSSSMDSFSINSNGKQRNKIRSSKSDGAFVCRIVPQIIEHSPDVTNGSATENKNQQGVITRQKRKIIDRSRRETISDVHSVPHEEPIQNSINSIDKEFVDKANKMEDEISTILPIEIIDDVIDKTPIITNIAENTKEIIPIVIEADKLVTGESRKRPFSSNESDIVSKLGKQDTEPSVPSFCQSVTKVSENIISDMTVGFKPTPIVAKPVPVITGSIPLSISTPVMSTANTSHTSVGNIVLPPSLLNNIRLPSSGPLNLPLPLNSGALLEAAAAAVRAEQLAGGNVSPAAAVAALFNKMVALETGRLVNLPMGAALPVSNCGANKTQKVQPLMKNLTESSRAPVSHTSGILNSPIKQFLDRTKSLTAAPDHPAPRGEPQADEDMPTDLSMKTMKRLEEESRINPALPQDEPLNLSLKSHNSNLSVKPSTPVSAKVQSSSFNVLKPSPLSSSNVVSRIAHAHSSTFSRQVPSLPISQPVPALTRPQPSAKHHQSQTLDHLASFRCSKSTAEAVAALTVLRMNVPGSTSTSLNLNGIKLGPDPASINALSLAALASPQGVGIPLAALCQLPVVASKSSAPVKRKEPSSHSSIALCQPNLNQSNLPLNIQQDSNSSATKVIQPALPVPSVSLLQAAAAAAANYRPQLQLFAPISSSSSNLLTPVTPPSTGPLLGANSAAVAAAAASFAASIASAAAAVAAGSAGNRLPYPGSLGVSGGGSTPITPAALFLPNIPPFFLPRLATATTVSAGSTVQPK